MTRYIDADKLIKEIISKDENMTDISNNRHRGMFTDDIISCIKGMPIEDVKPVIHARWELNSDEYNYECGNCEYQSLTMDDVCVYGMKLSKYCPKCGAEMDED